MALWEILAAVILLGILLGALSVLLAGAVIALLVAIFIQAIRTLIKALLILSGLGLAAWIWKRA